MIKEINQVQVHTTNNNNAAASRPTTTSATQTDFPEEIISHLSNSNVKNNLFTICESESAPGKCFVVRDFINYILRMLYKHHSKC